MWTIHLAFFYFCITFISSLALFNNSSVLHDRFNLSPSFPRTNQRQIFPYTIQFKLLKQGLKGDFAEIKKQKKNVKGKYALGNKQQQDSSIDYCTLYTFMLAIMLGTKI